MGCGGKWLLIAADLLGGVGWSLWAEHCALSWHHRGGGWFPWLSFCDAILDTKAWLACDKQNWLSPCHNFFENSLYRIKSLAAFAILTS